MSFYILDHTLIKGVRVTGIMIDGHEAVRVPTRKHAEVWLQTHGYIAALSGRKLV